MTRRAARSVDELFDLLADCDGAFDSIPARAAGHSGPDGDAIDILSHELQCADLLARASPDDLELHVAGLVHDVGHVLAPGRAAQHGDLGAAFVRPVLGERAARLTALHVPAKRYLVTTQRSYESQLSEGSTISLELQGGRLTDDERAALEADPHFADALTLRRADEAAKEVGRVVPGLERWRPVIEELVARRPIRNARARRR
jgi:predicted HD phosphohydrolase